MKIIPETPELRGGLLGTFDVVIPVQGNQDIIQRLSGDLSMNMTRLGSIFLYQNIKEDSHLWSHVYFLFCMC